MTPSERDALLRAYLHELARREVAPGEPTCALALGEWWNRVRGGVPAASFLADYLASDDEGRGISHMHFPRLIARAAREVGATRTAEPRPGDGAVISAIGKTFAAIRTPSHRWAVKCGPGLYATRSCRVLAAWTI